ncbi:MAG: hypothetical protein EBS55_11580, partial [Flavobacteriaceae bacterium]|nr:hypothetical protein [Flavobacteriaceae bacterium]
FGKPTSFKKRRMGVALATADDVTEARSRAEKIRYGYKIEGNQLILDNYMLTDVANKFRDQKVELFLYLPKGTLFKTDENVKDYNQTSNYFFNLHFNSKYYVYKVEDSKVKCLNCPADENDYDDVKVTDENDSVKTVSLKINGKTVIETKSEKPKKSKLIIDKHGIIIKTN